MAEAQAEEVKLPKAVRDKMTRMEAAFDKIDRLLYRLGQQGLQRMSASSAVELQALQQTAHNAALITVERQIEILAAHVQRYLDKDPLFTLDDYMSTINKIWLLNKQARALFEAGKLPDEMIDVIGETRRSYTMMDEDLTLQPLGASGWVTDTDFVGITLYFYVDGKDEIYEASSCKPTMYFGTNPRRLMTQPISDYVSQSIYDMSHGAYTFRNAKVSRDGRLSLHKDLEIRKAPYIGGKAYSALAVRNWKELLERLKASQTNPVGASAASLVFIEPTNYWPLQIDQKNAKATAEIDDDQGARLQIEVPLRAENNFLVDNLEYMLSPKGKSVRPNAIFGRAWTSEGRLKLFPYTAVYNQAVIVNDHGQKRVNEVHLSLESMKVVKGA